MTVTAALRKALVSRLKSQTLYAVARDSGVQYDTLHRFVHNEDQQLRSDNLDALCAYLRLELRPKAVAKPAGRKKS